MDVAQFICVRQHRWTLEAHSEDGEYLSPLVQKAVDIDFFKHHLNIESFDVLIESNVLDWAETLLKSQMANENKKRWMVFTTYDGVGNPIYKYTFNNIRLLSRSQSFDMEISDIATHKMVVSFSGFSREVMPVQNNDEIKGN